MEKNLVFVSGFAGKSKKTNQPFCSIELVDPESVNAFDKRIEAKHLSLFVKVAPVILPELRFGDVVTCVFEQTSLDSAPELINITKVFLKSPYVKFK
ncbi:MAG: hypothetical protein LBT30_04915 [Clostridiales bacterium]|jgi:hypothetical protein|nr:hypothetical protein [Clostridiales bacterium]